MVGHTRPMTDESSSGPVPGWYPDPEDSRYLRWWSGYRWELRKPLPAPGGGGSTWVTKPLGRWFPRLATLLGVLLGLTSVVLVARLGHAAWGLSMFEGAVATGDVEALDTYDSLAVVLGVLLVGTMVASGICWMVWQYQLARSARPGELRRGPGMHAFSWLIPFVALWFPFQNIKDLWLLHIPSRSRQILGWWWTGWITALVLDRIFVASWDDTDTVAEVEGLMVLEAVTAGVGLLTALVAIRIVRGLTAGVLARSTEDPLTRAGSPAA